ncbi:MAG: serine/threonine-protein kinase, partial [Myxococcota bacterium]
MVDATFEMPERPALSEVDLELTHTTVMARLFGRPPATVRFGRFELTQRLGSGAQGEVYLAHDPGLDRPVAVKIVGQAAPGPQTHRDLRQEARALARLSHPNVLSVFDVGVHDGAVFVVTEYVRGSTLRTWLDDGPRTPDEILSVFVDAARGLAAVHAAGLVHRDFKPANV